MAEQEKLDKGWREIIAEAEQSAKAEREPERTNLELTAGKWSIKLLSDGEHYSFPVIQTDGTEKRVHGVSFICNAKNLDTSENFPNHNWGVTAGTLLKKLKQFKILTNVRVKFLASGEGRDRRYSDIEVIE